MGLAITRQYLGVDKRPGHSDVVADNLDVVQTQARGVPRKNLDDLGRAAQLRHIAAHDAYSRWLLTAHRIRPPPVRLSGWEASHVG